jgi:hypothetical protein
VAPAPCESLSRQPDAAGPARRSGSLTSAAATALPPDPQVRRKADPAKEQVKEFVRAWADSPLVSSEISQAEIKGARRRRRAARGGLRARALVRMSQPPLLRPSPRRSGDPF